MSKEDKPHYVSNKELFQAYVAWYAEIEKALTEGQEEPPIPRYIAECMIKICTRLSYRPNFVNYSYRDEMVADGIENCVRKAKKFNPAKSENPFSYITTIAYHTFIHRIGVEKNQAAIKGRLISEIDMSELVNLQDHDSDYADMRGQFVDFLKEHSYLVTEDVIRHSKTKKAKLSDDITVDDFPEPEAPVEE